ncbi:MAG: maleylpyruvate isomerase family mycothiol-dependent enzyme [Ilumatobacteraceae bacterium]
MNPPVNRRVNPGVDWSGHIDAIRADTERMAAAYEAGPTDAAVAACPGWDVRDLVEHMAYIHRWAGFAVRHGRPPEPGDVDVAAEDADLAAWLRAGGNTLADDLAAADPQADTWHVFPAEQKMWVWARRQAQETAMHRWDAETATGGRSSLDPVLAANGVEEYLELGLPRVLIRESVTPPESTLHLRATDVASDWTITSEAGVCTVQARVGEAAAETAAEVPSGEAALHGTAESLLLVLMGRADRAAIEIVGDPAVADEWLSLPGW